MAAVAQYLQEGGQGAARSSGWRQAGDDRPDANVTPAEQFGIPCDRNHDYYWNEQVSLSCPRGGAVGLALACRHARILWLLQRWLF